MKKELQLNESLAALGHGKWKRALGCTLLMIGLLMGGMNAWGQSGAPVGLEMKKTFIDTIGDGHQGIIQLETYVTGHSVSINAAVPTDIILVLDLSNSMTSNNMGSITRLAALKESVNGFIDTIVADSRRNNNVEHRIAIVGYNDPSTTYLVSHPNQPRIPNMASYSYRDALQIANVNGSRNTYISESVVNGMTTNSHTYMNTGMQAALDILNSRTDDDKVFTSNGITLPRNMVVVFFTDGYPVNNQWEQTEGWPSDGYGVLDIADGATSIANTIKHVQVVASDSIKSPKIYSIGVFDDADPTANHKTEQGYFTYVKNGRTRTVYGWYTGTAAANGLMHFVSSDYDTITSWSYNTTRIEKTVTDKSYYFAATSADSLNKIFSNIASQSGGATYNLGSSTIVQDVVTPAFKIPTGATGTVKAYAPKYGIYNGEVGFDTLRDGLLVLDNNGVVDETQGSENMLPSSVVTVVDSAIQITGFNFGEMWCGTKEDGGITTYHGRKLVIQIPVEVEEGVWGDGIETNVGPLSYITENGEIVAYYDTPTVNVLGDVWTEIVTTKPDSFNANQDPIEIGTPEDLAWFISYVNGRAGYDSGDTISPSHPSANGKLVADIDMSAHNWVPIGSGYENAGGVNDTTKKLSYKGTFDGNGHVITGLKNNASKMYKKANEQGEKSVVVFPGMFANVEGDGVNTGVVKNVFVLDADFRGKHHDEGFVHHGIIADTLTGGAIFNCEAVGKLTCNNDKPNEDMKLVYGGLVGFNDGGTIHSSMAMATLTGYSMGGLVGENDGIVANSFTNGVYNYIGTSAQEDPNDSGKLFRYVGGLVGRNHHWVPGDNGGTFSYGSVNNSYVRLQRGHTIANNEQFGQLVGTNKANNSNGSITHCYTSEMTQALNQVADDNTLTFPTYTNTYDPTLMRNGRSNDNMVCGTWNTQWGTYINGTPLLDTLNSKRGSYTEWKRTTAGGFVTSPNGGNINGDYPVLKIADFTCLASTDGISLDYSKSLSEMLVRHNNGTMNVNTKLPGQGSGHTGGGEHDYHVSQTVNKTQSDLIYGATINLYANDTTSMSTSDNTQVYIDENVSLLQGPNSNITAFTGQTMKSYSEGCVYEYNEETDEFVLVDSTNLYKPNKQRWHLVSSSLKNSKFGWSYGTIDDPHCYDNTVVQHNWDANPCGMWLESNNADEALFPTDTRSPFPIDFYCFYEPQYHWINFKRNSLSHWHMDDYEQNIPYTNETEFKQGKGYLLAIYPQYFQNMHTWKGVGKDEQFLQNRGTLNNGDIDIPVTYTTDAIIDLDGYKTGLEGYNLLGNPYQSYLDFDEFVEENSDLMANSKFANTYAVYDPNNDKYIQYQKGSSVGSETASRYINMHQGFFIQVNAEGTAAFTNDMRTNTTDTQTGFRGEQPAYPLINFTVTDYEGETDLAVLELNRPENDGAKKLRMGSPAGRIYFRYDNTNLAIYFRNSDKDYQTLNFSAEEDGNFTLSWNMANADFSSLTLVDNITGIKTDMLTHDHYTFEGRVDDYNTRFKIVFGEMNTNNEEEPVLEHFAFFDHGNLIVNGTGHFEVVDVMGRVLYAVELTDTQNTVSLPSNVRGVCMLCFTRNNETKVQKMVIQ